MLCLNHHNLNKVRTNVPLIYGMVELCSVRLTIARVPLGWDKRPTNPWLG
jgi:hypothetical protein